jgi:hypothetical protein
VPGLRSSLHKFYGRHHELIDRYGMPVSRMTTDHIKEYEIWKTKFQSDVDDKCKPYVKLTQMVKYLYRSIYIYIILFMSKCRHTI